MLAIDSAFESASLDTANGNAMTNELPQDTFIFGASCAPYAKSMEWPEVEWDRDFATMRKLNFNTIRIFAAWDRIEREEGAFNYAKQDLALELAERHGLKVVLNFGGVFGNLCGIYAPEYIRRNPACRPRQSAPSDAAHPWAPGVSVCSDTPAFRDRAFAFMTRTIQRYAESPALFAWMTWNEPASHLCYCPHTVARFQNWLCKKYDGDLDALNRLWGTEYPSASGLDQARGPGVLCRSATGCSSTEPVEDLGIKRDHEHPHRSPTTTNLVYTWAWRGQHAPLRPRRRPRRRDVHHGPLLLHGRAQVRRRHRRPERLQAEPAAQRLAGRETAHARARKRRRPQPGHGHAGAA